MTAPLILGTNSIKSTGYDVANSLRFNSGSSDHLNRSTSSGNRLKWTWSAWVKKTKNGADEDLFSGYHNSSNFTRIQIGDTGVINFINKTSGSQNGKIETNRIFRDTSAWYHFVIVWDSGNATAANRMRVYVNGVEETSFQSDTQPSQDQVSHVNQDSKTNYVGTFDGSGTFFNGYMAEVVLVDGQALDPTSFGEFDSDSPTIWKPKNVSGLTFGTNGFHLDFENSSSLGADVSGNSNNFTVNNLTSVDQSTDTCTNNFCTANFLDNFYAQSTFNNGLLQVISTTSNAAYNKGTFGVSKGKWYYEVKIVDSSSNGTIGVGWIASSPTSTTDQMKNKTNQSTYRDNGTIFGNGSEIVTGSSLANNDIVGVYFDADNNFVYYAKNGSFQNSGNPTSGASGTGGIDPGAVATATPEGFYFPAFGDHSGGQNVGIEFNFGSPSYTISSGNSDADGHGNFEYSVPSGYFTLCSKNLAEYG
jgi:hypothetical protein